MLSVVIPTFNAQDGLAQTLDLFQNFPMDYEIIISDGGSTDKTLEIAHHYDVKVVRAGKGRGIQMAQGARHAQGQWLLFLHADSQFENGWQEALKNHMDAHPNRAGYFKFRLDDEKGKAAKRLETIVALRCRFLALPYGDQGLLISRSLYDAVGGYGDMPLMEDVDIVRRLGAKRLLLIDMGLITSAVRYRSHGYVKRMLRNLVCLCLYFIGLSPHKIARLYG